MQEQTKITCGYALLNNFDWRWWQLFLSINEFGSLNKAAKALHISQPTLSRHLISMEKQLGQSLFDRSTKGLALTAYASNLLAEAKTMQASASRLQRIARGKELQLKGRIRLAVNEMFAHYYLPDLLPTFMDLYPEISVEIEVSNKASNIDKRDADIAIRMFPPTQLDLISRHISNIPLGFFASELFLHKNGKLQNLEQVLASRLLGFDRDQQLVDGGHSLGFKIRNEQFQLRSDFMPLQFQLAIKDAGIVATHKQLALERGLIQVATEVKLPSLPVYLVCHRDVHHNPRIRTMMDYLANHLPPYFAR